MKKGNSHSPIPFCVKGLTKAPLEFTLING